MLWFVQPSAWVFTELPGENLEAQFFVARHTAAERDRVLAIIAEHFGVRLDRIASHRTITNGIYTDVATGELDDIELLIEMEEAIEDWLQDAGIEEA